MGTELIKLVGTAAALLFYNHYSSPNRHPLHPWEKVGSANWVEFANPSADSVRVYAIAPEVDNAVRFVDAVAPGAVVYLRLPYADTKVTVLMIGPEGGTWRVQ